MSKTKAINKIKDIEGFRTIKRREYKGNMETTFVFDMLSNDITTMFNTENINRYNKITELIEEILDDNDVSYEFVNKGMGFLMYGQVDKQSPLGIEFTVDFPINR